MGPYLNGAGAILAIVATIANIAIMILEKSVWMVMFKRIVDTAYMPSILGPHLLGIHLAVPQKIGIACRWSSLGWL